MDYSKDYAAGRYARIAQAMGIDFEDTQEGAKKAVDAVKQLAADVHLPSFASLSVDPYDFEKLAELSAGNISTQSNPRPMEAADYLTVIRNAYKA